MRTSILLSASLFLATSLNAQKTRDGYALKWGNSITVARDSLQNGRYMVPAYTIMVYESDGTATLDHWRAAVKPTSRSISGSKPAKATGVDQPTLCPTPMMILAGGSSDKRTGAGRLTMAFLKNDSTAIDDAQAAEKAARDMAVRLNKAVVQAQVAQAEKNLQKVTGKVEDARATTADLDKKSARTKRDLEKLKSRQVKVQEQNARTSGEIASLEKKLLLANDPKDIAMLEKLRARLTTGGTELARLLKTEAGYMDDLNRIEREKPDAARQEADRTKAREQVVEEVEQLKRKLDNIR